MTPAPTHNPAPAGGPGTYRDSWGIPHLWAESADDLAYLQGLNAASDRSWQIELERWRSEGRAAEVLGPDAVVWDRFARQARLDDTARRCFENFDDDTKRWCGQYVAGVNQALSEGLRGGPEFDESGGAPELWNPWTPLGVFLVHHILFSTFPNKLFRAHVARTLGDDAVGLFSIEAPVWSGSNAWAAHGSETASGLPLVAGDPHRLMELPGVYQQVRLACPEFDAIGFAFPGVPGLPHFAHTGHTAWAITNAMADYQDLFEEELRRVTDVDGERVEARGAEGWEPVVVSTETVRVRGGDAVDVEVMETMRGSVISAAPDGGALSLRFPARVEGRLGFEALLPLLRSRNVSEVEAAFDAWVEPVNSVVAADDSGAVRHFVAGLVPQRNPSNRRLPAPAFSARHAWDGQYVVLPRTKVQRFAVSANDRAAGGGDAVAMEFAPAHRALRIRELLEAAPGGSLTVDTMQAIHTDTQLGPWPVFRSILSGLDADDLSGEAKELRSELLGWDGRMDAASHQAAVLAAWRGVLVQRIARHSALAPLHEPTAYSPLFGPWLSVPSRIGFALETLLARGSELGISVGVEAAAALEDVALEEALLDGASWGERHQLLAVHVLPGALSEAAPAADLSGDTGCVLCTESLPGVDDRSFRGPVARYVWDLSDRANSRWIVPFGAAGTPEHEHFADQLPLWTAGKLAPVVTDWSVLTKDTP
ncbi:penicillin acylase family protein [Paenarthrobacter nitroguajacolicus]|uniref:Penicillin acylase family protein n=1 Tax=Paenarthrobacter nitroguajacolicus TaxID=211146 RepID=A0A558H4A5_PAENT|nr:penicillin acylase family protein [Paenarthrobacter nitroguajacolicus]TVU63921.1 penicillin acylase family protein [Paenarthrobacter nitroguajacolicus]